MSVFIAMLDAKYSIQGVGATRKAALHAAEKTWRTFWANSPYPPQYTWKEAVEGGDVYVAEVEVGQGYIDWNKFK